MRGGLGIRRVPQNQRKVSVYRVKYSKTLRYTGNTVLVNPPSSSMEYVNSVPQIVRMFREDSQ